MLYCNGLAPSFQYYDYLLSKARRSFGHEVLALKLQATFLVSNGNNIVACNFARVAANDVKGHQTFVSPLILI